MQMANLTTEATMMSFDEAPVLKLVIAYDDFAHGLCAMNFVKWLIDDFGRLFTFVPRFLRFEELLRRDVAGQAAQEAEEADLIVVAAYEEGDPPAVVQEWLQTCTGQAKKEDGAFLARLSTSEEGGSWKKPVEAHLRRQLAQRTKTEFASTQIDWPAKEVGFPVRISHKQNGRSKSKSGTLRAEEREHSLASAV